MPLVALFRHRLDNLAACRGLDIVGVQGKVDRQAQDYSAYLDLVRFPLVAFIQPLLLADDSHRKVGEDDYAGHPVFCKCVFCCFKDIGGGGMRSTETLITYASAPQVALTDTLVRSPLCSWPVSSAFAMCHCSDTPLLVVPRL